MSAFTYLVCKKADTEAVITAFSQYLSPRQYSYVLSDECPVVFKPRCNMWQSIVLEGYHSSLSIALTIEASVVEKYAKRGHSQAEIDDYVKQQTHKLLRSKHVAPRFAMTQAIEAVSQTHFFYIGWLDIGYRYDAQHQRIYLPFFPDKQHVNALPETFIENTLYCLIQASKPSA